MKLNVLLFAQLAESVGSRSIEIELPDGSTVSAALESLGDAHPSIAILADRIAVAVDETYVAPAHVLEPGQTLALIPPVSGG